MSLLPTASCPNCKGPVTFVQVLSIVTPLQSIDCTTCGEMLFLIHRSELMIGTIAIAFLVLVGGMFAVTNGWMSLPAVYGAVLICVAAIELVVTTLIVKHNALVVRRNK